MDPTANSLVRGLMDHQLKLVLAESCTAGMAAALLGQIPGVSAVLCGSAVTYRQQTKHQWLGIPIELIQQHQAESKAVTEAMVTSALANTMEASVAAAITGHLGPGAPAQLDGKIFISVRNRTDQYSVTHQHQLRSDSRIDRQLEAAQRMVADILAFVRGQEA